MARLSRTLTAHCSIRDTEAKLSFSKADILRDLKAELEKRLGKKGVTVEWLDATQTPQLALNLLRIDEGNQMLRYLVPFTGAACVEIEGELNVDSESPREFHFIKRAYFGLFGGSAQGMLRVCVVAIAKSITKDVLKTLKAAEGRQSA